jgi:hypothetical protein
MAVTNETKKRSSLKRGSILDLPPDLDRKRFRYRWVSKTRLDFASDGYEPRGYVPHTTADNKSISRGDLILCKKTVEDAQAEDEERRERSNRRMQTLLENQKSEDDKIAYEVKKAGGKMKFEYGEE